jgi:cysteine desulfurase
MAQRIFLDANAGGPVKPQAARAVADALARAGNPSSVHAEGRSARRAVENAREAIARAFATEPSRIVFTSGGTEGNSLALLGSGRRRVIVSAVEHVSVLKAAERPILVPCDANGVVRLDALSDAIGDDGRDAVVSVMAANNETGVIQPTEAVVERAHAKGALVHVDAAQAPGRMPVPGADLITLSAHKMGGPSGVGALILASAVDLAPVMKGGGQERGRRAGTEAVALIAGFGAAAALIRDDIAERDRIEGLRDRLEAALPDATFHGAGAPRLPNTSAIGMAGVAAATQVMAFDLAGFAVSAGSACSSGKVGRSHVLAAMGLDESEAGCVIRVSLRADTTETEVDDFALAWLDLRARLARTRAAA